MTFEAPMRQFEISWSEEFSAPRKVHSLPPIPADPEPGWATRYPDRAMAFLYVSPRDCAAVDEMLAR